MTLFYLVDYCVKWVTTSWTHCSSEYFAQIPYKDRIVVFDFEPTLENYRVTVFGYSKRSSAEDGKTLMGTSGNNSYDGRGSIVSSIIVAVGSTFLTTTIALLASYGISRMQFWGSQGYLNWILLKFY